MRLPRMIRTATFTSRNTISIIVLATWMRSRMLRKAIIRTMKAAVARMLTWGVWNRREVFWKPPGRSPSWLMAIGVRDAARMPLLPVVTKARMAANASSIAPPRPRNLPPAVLRGVMFPYGPADRSPASTTPTTTNTART